MASKEKSEIPPSSYVRLQYSRDLILSTEDFINGVALHKKDLKSPANIGLMNFMKIIGNNDFNPAGLLKEYIYLEANSFFEIAKYLKDSKGHTNMPALPDYFEKLHELRNKFIAHRDKKEKIKFPEDWADYLGEIGRLIPMKKLIKDVNDYFLSVQPSLKG